MSTKAAIIIKNEHGSWTSVYCHFDGNPEHMLPALKAFDEADILAAREIRGITAKAIEAFPQPRNPEVTAKPEFPIWASFAYVMTPLGWEVAETQRQLDALTK